MSEIPRLISADDAVRVELPPAIPKPTSLDGQFEASVTLWESPDGIVEFGVWECTPGTFTAHRDGYDEIAQVVAGTATITGDDGTTVSVGPGSTVIQPDGWRGTWVVHETIRKTYVIRVAR